MNFLIQIFICLSAAEPINSPGPIPTEYIDSAQLDNYYPDAPIRSLPPQTQFQFTRMLNLLIQPNARRSKLYYHGFFACEVVAEQNNPNQLRVSLPKTVTTTTVTPYDENRVCIADRIPIPESLNSETFDGNCQVEGAFIVNMTGKCFAAVNKHDQGSIYWTTNVVGRNDNPRLFAIAGLNERLEASCKKDTQMIEIDFEGDLKMVCYDPQGYTKMSEVVKAVQDAFGITIRVPVPTNLHDINLRVPAPGPRPPVSI